MSLRGGAINNNSSDKKDRGRAMVRICQFDGHSLRATAFKSQFFSYFFLPFFSRLVLNCKLIICCRCFQARLHVWLTIPFFWVRFHAFLLRVLRCWLSSRREGYKLVYKFFSCCYVVLAEPCLFPLLFCFTQKRREAISYRLYRL